MLTAKDISLFRGDAAILRDVSAQVTPGRVTAIIGPNGAGKSTLLACLAGLVRPDAGATILDEAPLNALLATARAKAIGLLPQQGEVHWDVDVATLVSLGRLPHRKRWGESDEDRDAVRRAMTATGCSALAHRPVNHLSGGERARALLARVLAGEPRYLLADEPLANLDPGYQMDMLSLIRTSARADGMGVALVIHDLTQAARVADEVLVLKKGTVLASGPADEVLTAPILSEAFEVAMHIGQDVTGGRIIVPVGRI